MMSRPHPHKENSLLSILFNIAIPVLVLNKLSRPLGSVGALVLALSIPLLYGAYDLVRVKKINFFSILGLLNVLITGGLALLGLKGLWFAIKEAAFPFLIGIFVFFSAYTKKPFIESLFLNPSMFKIELIWQQLAERRQATQFHRYIKWSTIFLSISFFISSLLNFFIAESIFKPIDDTLSAEAQSEILNGQIAQMTTTGQLIIMLPSFLLLLGIFWYLIHGIQKTTGLHWEDLLIQK